MTKERNKTHTITGCALFSALICVVSPFVIPIGPVPVSLSAFAVMLTGSVLPAKKAFVAVMIYILIGGVGVPVFSGFQGGINCLLGPTGGYIWSYLIVAALVAFSVKYSFALRIICAFVSLVICYFLGTVQYMFVSGTENLWGSLILCVFPFLPFDIIKTLSAVILGDRVRNILIKQNLL